MPTPLPELSANGLVLWRMRRSPEDQRWCVVGNLRGDLTLTTYDPASTAVPVKEVFPTITSLVSRADALKEWFATSGWELLDVDLDEPD